MTVLPDRVIESSDSYRENRDSLLRQIAAHDEQLALVNGGGGPKYVERHRGRGKMLVRERIEALLDPGAPFLEL